jgi:pSer/pThr/pTyr-binding forkhead associated (FHA) protein
MNVKLKVLRGASEGKEFILPSPEGIIGRNPGCDLRPRSQVISRYHCAVHVRDGKIFVRDLKSHNGTFLNGRRLEEECEVQTGDRLQIGPLVFEIRANDAVFVEKSSLVASAKEAGQDPKNGSRTVPVSVDRTHESTIDRLETRRLPKTVGKLPPRAEEPALDPSDAAARTLKRFFSGRS